MNGYGFSGQPNPPSPPGQKRSHAAALVAIPFVVALAGVIGWRLSEQALAVLAGAICGVATSIPTSLLVIWVALRRQETRERETYRQESYRPPQNGTYPPVIVLQQPPAGLLPGSAAHISRPPIQREFTVVGGEDDGDGRYG